MKKALITIGIIILIAIVLQTLGISVPHYLTPKKDIETSELNQPSLEKKVLVASRSSDFKNAVLDKIKEEFNGDSVYIKFTGLKKLHGEDIGPYNVFVLINTCMAGSMDPVVKGFAQKQKDGKIIVLTTSGDGVWLPKIKDRSLDAVATASKKDKTGSVAKEIIDKIRASL